MKRNSVSHARTGDTVRSNCDMHFPVVFLLILRVLGGKEIHCLRILIPLSYAGRWSHSDSRVFSENRKVIVRLKFTSRRRRLRMLADDVVFAVPAYPWRRNYRSALKKCPLPPITCH